MIQFANNFQASLTSSIAAADTAIPLTTTSGLPTLTAASPLYLTLETSDQLTREIVRVEEVSGNTITVVRGLDGTSPFAFPMGSVAEVRLPRIALQEFVQKSGGQTISGDLTLEGTLDASSVATAALKDAAGAVRLNTTDAGIFVTGSAGHEVQIGNTATKIAGGGHLVGIATGVEFWRCNYDADYFQVNRLLRANAGIYAVEDITSTHHLTIDSRGQASSATELNFYNDYAGPGGAWDVVTLDSDGSMRIRAFTDNTASVIAKQFKFLADGALVVQGTGNFGDVLYATKNMRITGTSTGTANSSWLGFYQSDGNARDAYIGIGSTSSYDLYLHQEHFGANTVIRGYNSAGTLRSTGIFGGDNAQAWLYYDGTLRFNTTSIGTYTSGTAAISSTVAHVGYHQHYDYDDGYGSANYLRSYLRDGIYYTYGAGNAVDWTHRLQKGNLHVGYSKTSGSTYLTIEADTDNNNESDHPVLDFKQDGAGVIWRLQIGGTNGNSFAIRNTVGTERNVELWNQAGTSATMQLNSETGVGTGADWIATSDRRIKSNIERIDRALQRLSAVTGCTFNKQGAARRMAGVIAQDVEEALPEAVVDGNVKAVSAQAMIGLLVEAVKELEQRVEALQ